MHSHHDADVVVIGAGVGGLTAAAFLQSMGRHCVVVDRHSVVGGNVSAFTHRGFEFDVGMHYVGDCGPGGMVADLLTMLGLEDRLRWRPLDPDCFDRYHFPDATYEIPADLEVYRERLTSWFPREREGIDSFCDFAAAADDVVRSTLAGRVSEHMARLLAHRDSTMGDLFDGWAMSPRLRAVLTAQNLIYGVAPSRVSALFHGLAVMHYMNGAYYAEGGGQHLTDTLARCIRDRGGEVILQTPVESVIVEDGAARGVRLRPPSPLRRRGVPTEIRAPVVLSNADLKRTVLGLVGAEHFPAGYVRGIEALHMAAPMMVTYLVLDRDLAAEGYTNSNAFVVAGDDLDAEYEARARNEMVDPTVFMSFASIKDPTNERLCRPGQTNLQAMVLAPSDHGFWGLDAGPLGGERYRRNPEYTARKQQLVDMVLDRAEVVVPGLRDCIVHVEGSTPVTHERFVHSSAGTSYGFEITPEQILDRRPGPVTPLPGLYLTGQGTTMGHGIMACMAGGAASAGMITGEPLLQQATEGHRLAAGDADAAAAAY